MILPENCLIHLFLYSCFCDKLIALNDSSIAAPIQRLSAENDRGVSQGYSTQYKVFAYEASDG